MEAKSKILGICILGIMIIFFNYSCTYSNRIILNGPWSVKEVTICGSDLTPHFLFKIINFDEIRNSTGYGQVSFPHLNYKEKNKGFYGFTENGDSLSIIDTSHGIFEGLYEIEFPKKNQIIIENSNIRIFCEKMVFSSVNSRIEIDVFDFIKGEKDIEEFQGREIRDFVEDTLCPVHRKVTPVRRSMSKDNDRK